MSVLASAPPAPSPEAAIAANPRERAARRRQPRIFDTDWLMLKELARAIAERLDLLARAGMTAIDLGCGSQPYRLLVEERGIGYRGADLGDSAELTISADGKVNAADASADLVLSVQVLEHVRDIDSYLAEARRLLKADGRLLLSTHGTWLYHPHPEDHRRWTRQGLIGDLEARGFEVEHCISLVGPLAWTTLIRLTGFAFALRTVPLVGGPMAALLAAVMNFRAWIEDRLTPEWVRADNGCVYLVTAKAVPKP